MDINNYGIYTFNDEVMKDRLPKTTYENFKELLEKREPLNSEMASIIANAMKTWALEKGATHFTHWFSPLNRQSAEKHNSFLNLDNNKISLEFSGKLLRKGESDASSFPSGGLRATFEARGYTSWDCTSLAFIKNKSLYIPTLFSSYNGEALDDKTPLLKSCDALSKYATRLLNSLGLNNVKNVTSYVGAEQEYFLIPEELYQKRLDLKMTGRTLFGAFAPKCQEKIGHYYGSISPKVASFMEELDNELWKFAIPSKTKHNEASPSQHELACIYQKVNITTDNNNLTMQLMQEIALKHNLRCLLHEKPFKGVNGSGKHNNWSVITNTGINLFETGKDPLKNTPFLATLACIIKGVDEYADLLRLSIASASNDHRLGGNEAPPAIISMFLGKDINSIIDCFVDDKELKDFEKMRFETGVSVIPTFKKDSTDRNRTSPFAFTGNKFEFRGVGSSQSIAFANTMLNSILAYEMKEMADLIEQGNQVNDVIKQFLSSHKRIIFDGDGYSSAWKKIAKERNLSNKTSCVEVINALKDTKLTNMLIDLKVFSQSELDSRYEIMLEDYCKSIQVEALTAIRMCRNDFYPSCLKYLNKMSKTSYNVRKVGINNSYIQKEVITYSYELEKLINQINLLEDKVNKAMNNETYSYETSLIWKDEVLLTLDGLRKIVDELELITPKQYWPVPTYTDLLFNN